MSELSTPAWVHPGAEVVIVSQSGWHSRIVRRAVVAKVGKRDIVLEGGSRFRASDLHEQGRSRYHSDHLLAPDSPEVARIEAEARTTAADVAARKAVDSWLRDRGSRVRLSEAIQGLTELDALLATAEEATDA